MQSPLEGMGHPSHSPLLVVAHLHHSIGSPQASGSRGAEHCLEGSGTLSLCHKSDRFSIERSLGCRRVASARLGCATALQAVLLVGQGSYIRELNVPTPGKGEPWCHCSSGTTPPFGLRHPQQTCRQPSRRLPLALADVLTCLLVYAEISAAWRKSPTCVLANQNLR